jgi:cytidine deaminase
LADENETFRMLIEAARSASRKTYSPYSRYAVGSAVLTHDGRLFTGCNVENASYGGTICAERTALVKAVSEGFTRFKAIAIVCGNAHDCWPCGICRQFICEFGTDIEVLVEGQDGAIKALRLAELLPHHFGPQQLSR